MLPVALRTIHSNPGVAVRVGEKSLTWHPLGFRKCLSSSRLTASNFFSCPNLNVKLRSAAKAGTGSRDRRSRCLCFLSHLFGKVEVLQKKKGGRKKKTKNKTKSLLHDTTAAQTSLTSPWQQVFSSAPNKGTLWVEEMCWGLGGRAWLP